MKKNLFSSLIAVILVLSMSVACFAACNKDADDDNKVDYTYKDGKVNFEGKVGGSSSGSAITVDLDYTLTDDEDHSDDADFELYDANLGEYYKTFVAAKAQEDVDAKYAAMAIAEAKLLESAVFLPTTSQGGQYAISRIAPYTVSPTLWGLDSDRRYSAVLTNEIIKTTDRDALKALYKEVKGTGTYIQKAKEYLTSHGYTLKTTYNRPSSSDPKTWDITNTYRAADSEAIVNTYDGLIEYDVEGRLTGALATDLTVSEDGLKYTFKIREGVYWVDKDGRKYAEVTAKDWVDGLERVMKNDMTAYLVNGIIKGASAFIAGDTDDMSTVGIKAIDKYTLEYELEAPCSYFITMFNYNPFAPVCKEYIESTKDAQGEETYGTAPDKILYCGPYLVTNYTKDNKIVFEANPEYWNKDALNVQTINWISYNGNEDVTATYKDMKANVIDNCNLNTTTITLANTDNMQDYIYVSGTDATTYSFFLNMNRQAYSTEGYEADSAQTADQKAVTAAAMKNADFRKAFARGLDRVAYNAIEVGEDCALYSLQNSFTPGSFVSLSKDVTIDINGTATTFKKGTFYGAIVQAQLDADMGDKAMKVWDATAEGGLGSSSGFDGWYNKTLALEYFEKALTALAEEGVVVTADNPIHIDYPVYYEYETYKNRAEALKQKIAETFDGKVVLDIVKVTLYGWYYTGYYCDGGADCNYDIYDCSGWGPDYGDPATYLNTMLPVIGDMVHMLGVY